MNLLLKNNVSARNGGGSPNTDINDPGFLSALMDTLKAIYSIGAEQVYSTGMSMGAIPKEVR